MRRSNITDMDNLYDVMYIDREVYPKEYQYNYKELKQRFMIYPGGYYFDEIEEGIVGYIATIPLSEKGLKRVKEGKGLLDNPDKEDVDRNSKVVYIDSIAYLYEKQRQGYSYSLYNSMVKEMQNEKQGGIEVYALGVTEDGLKFLSSLGFSIVKNYSYGVSLFYKLEEIKKERE